MILRIVLVAAIIAAGLALWLSGPQRHAEPLPDHNTDIANGERVFWAGGCASCHATPVNGRRAQGDDKLRLGGGMAFETEFGTFFAPNISPDPVNGIGDWSALDLVNAMQYGVSPGGKHYYPAFPYTSYARMRVEDILDLKAFLDSLPATAERSSDHELGFPWSVRRGIGFWKRVYLDDAPVVDVDTGDSVLARGRYLVEGAGHCGECHTPRDARGGLDLSQWLAGAPNPDGPGSVPNITPGADTIGDWSVGDLAYYFESGFTPDFDTVGGSMVAVQENLAKLPAADRTAIATYLKAVPAH